MLSFAEDRFIDKGEYLEQASTIHQKPSFIKIKIGKKSQVYLRKVVAHKVPNLELSIKLARGDEAFDVIIRDPAKKIHRQAHKVILRASEGAKVSMLFPVAEKKLIMEIISKKEKRIYILTKIENSEISSLGIGWKCVFDRIEAGEGASP